MEILNEFSKTVSEEKNKFLKYRNSNSFDQGTLNKVVVYLHQHEVAAFLESFMT